MDGLVNLTPEIVFINDTMINVELLDQYILNESNYTIKLIWLDGSVSGLRFDNLYQCRAGIGKLDKAMRYLLRGEY